VKIQTALSATSSRNHAQIQKPEVNPSSTAGGFPEGNGAVHTVGEKQQRKGEIQLARTYPPESETGRTP
jgi:hypothetical protein